MRHIHPFFRTLTVITGLMLGSAFGAVSTGGVQWLAVALVALGAWALVSLMVDADDLHRIMRAAAEDPEPPKPWGADLLKERDR